MITEALRSPGSMLPGAVDQLVGISLHKTVLDD
jgi:hypothetical protein